MGSGTNLPRFHKQITENGKQMLNENAKKLVAALRSGEYEQGTGWLCNGGKHCCLGVASELYAKENPDFTVIDKDGIKTFGGNTATCPLSVKNWLGLWSDFGTTKDENKSLVSLNDTGFTFNEIADFIESEPEGLFV